MSSVGYRWVLKSPTTTVLESLHAFKFFRVCLMKMDALTLGAYRWIFVISFWWISPFISMKCPSLSHLTNVSLTSTLSEISIATPACFQGPFAWSIFQPFTLSQYLFLLMRWFSCIQQIVRSSFFIQFDKWCLLMGKLSPWHSGLVSIGMW
jgi:hypothetical protein